MDVYAEALICIYRKLQLDMDKRPSKDRRPKMNAEYFSLDATSK
jgi:hypothetical protein